MSQRFTVMGAGEVGFYLARELSQEGHKVVVIECDPVQKARVEDALDVSVVLGNGAHVPVLEAAKVQNSDLFMAVSSSDEANLAASVLAKRMGAHRTAVRVGVAEDVTVHRRFYEEVFAVDLLLSTQLLATTRILNYVLGHNTLAVEYMAQGKVQLRKIHLDRGSILTRKPLREIDMPEGSKLIAYERRGNLVVPAGEDQALPDDAVFILCKTEVIDQVERLLSARPRTLGTAIIAGGGATSFTMAKALTGQVDQVKIIERDLDRASELAAQFPNFEVLHGDATDISLLRAERVAEARSFIALTGNDDSNLMACLLAQELGVKQVIALVQRTETSHLWRKVGLVHVVSPRRIASERIRDYVQSDYSVNIMPLERGKIQVIERRLAPASPAAGVTLAEMNPPQGVLVGAVVRGEEVIVPTGEDRLEVGDSVLLFVQEEHLPTINLLFPGRDPAALDPARVT